MESGAFVTVSRCQGDWGNAGLRVAVAADGWGKALQLPAGLTELWVAALEKWRAGPVGPSLAGTAAPRSRISSLL